MSEIKFYIPKDETIPTALRLYVDDIYVEYERIDGGFLFHVYSDDEELAKGVVEKIIVHMIQEHDESEHGVSWRTTYLNIVSQKERYKVGTMFEWGYRVRDSF